MRIVSLAPSVTETLFALGLGDRVVGVTRFCNYPPEVETKARIGGFLDPNIEAIVALKPGATLGDIGHAIQTLVEDAGFSIIEELTGHGIGHTLHEPPYILNYGEPGDGEELFEGMCIAIEPIICMGRPDIETLDDDWTIVTRDGSLAIQHEHTLLITKHGNEVLTLRPGEIPLH